MKNIDKAVELVFYLLFGASFVSYFLEMKIEWIFYSTIIFFVFAIGYFIYNILINKASKNRVFLPKYYYLIFLINAILFLLLYINQSPKETYNLVLSLFWIYIWLQLINLKLTK